MPGSVQVGVIQTGKDIANEIYGQGVSKGVSEIYDKPRTHSQVQPQLQAIEQ